MQSSLPRFVELITSAAFATRGVQDCTENGMREPAASKSRFFHVLNGVRMGVGFSLPLPATQSVVLS